MNRFKELILAVKEWADQRGLIKASNIMAQYNYYHLELSELYEAIKKQEKALSTNPSLTDYELIQMINEIRDGFGDTMVTLICLAYAQTKDVNHKESFSVDTFDHNGKKWGNPDFSLTQSLQWLRYMSSRHYFAETTLSNLISICNHYGYDATDCLEYAYNQIKDRTGTLINGDYVKD